jgi:hypothetical protein
MAEEMGAFAFVVVIPISWWWYGGCGGGRSENRFVGGGLVVGVKSGRRDGSHVSAKRGQRDTR